MAKIKKDNGAVLSLKAEKAMQRAFRRVLEEHKRLGQPVIIWRAGKVVKISASRLLSRQ